MTIQVELDPETEARLNAEAARFGVAPEQYAGEFLRNNLPFHGSKDHKLTCEDIDRLTERLSAGSENLPVLPPEVNNRESYYEDRW